MPLTEPLLVGDISGNGRINALDASLIARFAAGFDLVQTAFAGGIAKSVPERQLERAGAVPTRAETPLPPLIGQGTDVVQGRSAAVDCVMARDYRFSSANDDKPDMLHSGDELNDILSALASI